ncbi:winged helix-turn-helix domain-containing protein [Enterobacter mori]|uniref:winged helix-turn-helix domain-containing protein n=1 Tax=Enterobacter mori TaxID=539813 RepID=UPI0011DCADC8|nr:helix-turn-helix domain-containing protein [Enterobacter mori]
MLLLINGSITLEFNVRSARLTSVQYPDIYVDISLTAGQLLRIMLLAKGQLLRYHLLIFMLWEKNKMRGSYNNLTLNILRLRDAIEIVGIDRNSITNIPGKGYSCNLTFSVIETSQIHVTSKLSIVKKGAGSKIFSMLFTMLSVTGIIIYYTLTKPQKFEGAFYLFSDKKCDIYTFDLVPAGLRPRLIKAYHENIPLTVQGCSKDEVGFLFIGDAFESGITHHSFFSKCQIQGNDIMSCQSFLKEVNE